MSDHELKVTNKKSASDVNLAISLNLNKENKYSLIKRSSENLEIIEKSDQNINVYIDEEKRLFNNEIHYFDHPLFGIVVSISKI